MGSTTVIDTLFFLNINTNQLIVIGISFLIYWFTIDNILEMLFEYLLGENPYAILSLAPTRMAAFYIIGIILNLNNTVNMTISIGVSLILLAIDMLFFFRKEGRIYEKKINIYWIRDAIRFPCITWYI